jgi:hypothetical protein
MNKRTVKHAVAVAVIGAVTFGAVPPSVAAPVSSSMAIVKQAAPSSAVTDIRYRHYRRYYGGPGPAFALGIMGLMAGAAIAGSGYYGPGYYGGPGYYAYGPAYYGPAYYGPGYYGYPYRRYYYYYGY